MIFIPSRTFPTKTGRLVFIVILGFFLALCARPLHASSSHDSHASSDTHSPVDHGSSHGSEHGSEVKHGGGHGKVSGHGAASAHGDDSSGSLLTGVAAYSPMLIIMAVAIGIGVAMLVVGGLIRPNKPNARKLMPYECGMEPTGDAMVRVIPRYYVYAMLFLAFEVESLFLFPWAIVFDRIGIFAFIEMVLFIVVLVIGLAYAWAKGALDWHY